jgi:putative restriction endonuclease
LPILDRRQIKEKIVEAIQSSGWNVLYGSSLDARPFNIRMYSEGESYALRIYIWNLSYGGKPRNPDEYRIQVKVDRFQQVSGQKTLVLGWSDDIGVFAGFDVRRHSGKLGYSSSIQVSLETLRKATINGISAHDKGNKEIAVAFLPEFFADYVRNLELLHDFGESAQDLQTLESVLEQVADEERVFDEGEINEFSLPRRTVVRTITQRLREASFKRRVLTAYNSQCAFCSLQLKLVDAAHIVPVAQEGSTDNTSNGLTLCSLHHRAYDNGLITIDESFKTLVSKRKMDDLRGIGHDGGMEQFIENLRPIIHIPPAGRDRPNADYIKQANQLRGWTKTQSVPPTLF